MNKITFATLAFFTALASASLASQKDANPSGLYEASWESLQRYETPEWFRDAKFGIWAHWGPQCEPEAGDWYARHMYMQKGPAWGSHVYESHCEHYGHPSEFGFKDVIREWKAELWDPESLVALYKRAGAQYFMALANHHDNLDLWDSKHQPWNSTKIGPRKDLIEGWRKAARAQGLRFGVSVHAAHAWTWFETSQGADVDGPLAGVPYDGKLTAADGEGTWWEGLDPQELYAQNHTPSEGFEDPRTIHSQWDWDNGASQPSKEYIDKFVNRTLDLIDQAEPDLLYFDDTVLPFYPISDVGLDIAAEYYNRNMEWNDGRNEAVIFGKILNDEQKQALVWDVERGVPNDIQEQPWQTCTCIGGWHYDRSVYDKAEYKSAKTVVHMLADIVSKNGNLLLSVPMRGDGTIDEKEVEIVEGIAAWMDVNKEAILATRPWKVFGEGPASAGVELKDQGFNEGKGKPFTAQDVRYTVSKDGKTLYVIAMGVPSEPLQLEALGTETAGSKVTRIELLGYDQGIRWKQESDSLVIEPIEGNPANDAALAIKLSLQSN